MWTLLLACRREWIFAEALPPTEPDPERVARKEALLAELAELDGTLLGQNVGHIDVSIDPALVESLPERPAVLGVDLGEQTSPVPLDGFLDLALDQVADGGVVTASMSLANPWTRRSAWSSEAGPLAEILDPRTEAGARWAQSLVHLGNQLQTLEDADVIVLLRPFHEANGGWFWWSALSPADYAELWATTRATLEEQRQLDHLVWVYSPNAETEGVDDVLSRWPGPGQAEIVGLSAYVEEPAELPGMGLDDLRATGLPVALTEVGPEFWKRKPEVDGRDLTVIAQLDVRWALFWSDWANRRMSLATLPHADVLFTEPGLLTLQDAPLGR